MHCYTDTRNRNDMANSYPINIKHLNTEHTTEIYITENLHQQTLIAITWSKYLYIKNINMKNINMKYLQVNKSTSIIENYENISSVSTFRVPWWRKQDCSLSERLNEKYLRWLSQNVKTPFYKLQKIDRFYERDKKRWRVFCAKKLRGFLKKK